MKKFFFAVGNGIHKILVEITLFFILVYQKTISPDKGIFSFWLRGRVCIHEPHCSQYSIDVFKRYGFIRGWIKTMDRITRCTGGWQKKYEPASFRVVFFSSAPIGIPFLQELFRDDSFDVVGVVTAPDKPAGRGMHIQPTIVKKWTQETGERGEVKGTRCGNFIQTPSTLAMKTEEGQQFFKRLQEKKPDYLVVIAYGFLIPQHILDVPVILPVNVHGSLLPKYRGASPIQSSFLFGDVEAGITLIHMVKKLDAGPMLAKCSCNLPFHWTARDLIVWMEKEGPLFLCKTLKNYPKGYCSVQEQDMRQVSFCGKFSKEDGEISIFRDSIETIYAKYRAFILWPGIFFFLQGKRFLIEELVLKEELYASHKMDCLSSSTGTLSPLVTSLRIKPEGKKALCREEFCNGYKTLLQKEA